MVKSKGPPKTFVYQPLNSQTDKCPCIVSEPKTTFFLLSLSVPYSTYH